MATNVEIFVTLLDEGTDVWRPTHGEIVGEGLYRILATQDYGTAGETWEFEPGTIVSCIEMVKAVDGKERKILVACQRKENGID